MNEFIYYQVGDKTVKVPSNNQEDFEKKIPDARVLYTYNGQNVGVPIGSKDAFISKFGAENITYSAYDDKNEYAPSLSTRKLMSFEEPEAFESPIDTVSYTAAMNAPEMSGRERRQARRAEKEAERRSAIDEDVANIVIDSHEGHKSAISETIARIDKEYNERIASEPKEDKSFWQKLVESMGQAGAERRLGASSFTAEQRMLDMEKGQDYVDAKIAEGISDKTDDKIDEYLDPSKTFVGGVAHGFADAVTKVDTWDSTVGAEQALRVYEITKKLDKGEELTEGEQLIIDALVDDIATDAYLSAGFGRGYKAGKVTGESLPFMLETMTNPASGFGKSVTKKFGKTVFRKVSEALGKKAGRAAVHLTRVGTDIAGAAAMSATSSQVKVAEDALNRLNGTVDFAVNDNGTLDFKGFKEDPEIGDSFLKAYGKAFKANTIEHFSEMVGNYFAPIGKMTRAKAAGLAEKIGLKKISSLLDEMTPSAFGSLFNDFFEQTQITGPIGEFSEEIIGGMLNALTVHDQSFRRYDKNGNLDPNYLFDKDNLIDTFLGVSILGGISSGVRIATYTTPENRYNREISRALRGLRGHFSEEEIAQLEAFANNPMGVDSANLIPFFDDTRSKEDKEAVGKYLSAIMQKQGYMMARQANISGTQQGMEEMRNAYQLGQNLTEADLYDADEAEARAIQELADTGLFGRLGELNYFYTEEELTNGFSSYELFAISQNQNINLTEEERKALKTLALVKNAKEGLNDNLNRLAQAAITSNNEIANGAAREGKLTQGLINGRIVYVKGDVQVANGKIVAPSNTGGHPIEVIDSMTGEVSVVESKDVSQVVVRDVAQYNEQMANIINQYFNDRRETWRQKKSTRSKLAEIEQMLGQSVYITTPEGAMAEVEIQQILPNGEVLITGKKGDLGGKSTIRIDVDSFYDSMSRDANGNPIFDQSQFRSQTEQINKAQERLYGQQNQQVPAAPAPAPQAPAQQTTPVAPVDYRDSEHEILIDGVPTTVYVENQDDASDNISYSYTDENGQKKTGSSSVADFTESIRHAEAYEPEVIENTADNQESIAPDTEAIPAEATTEIPSSEENIQLTPEEIDWDALFEQDKEAYFNELQNQFGEEASEMINGVIEATQQELDSLNKKKGKNQKEIFANINRKKALQAKISELNVLAERLNQTTEASVENTMPEPVEVPREKDPEPMTGVQFAARELGLRDGGIKLDVESFKHHTGYGSAEVKKFLGLFRGKDKGGMTLEAAGERLMELDRENNTGFFDQNDPNAGMNAILEALSLNRTMGELRSFAAREQQAEAQREADAAYSAMMAEYEARLGESVEDTIEAEEDSDAVVFGESSLNDEDYEDFLAIFTDETNDNGTDTNEGEISAVSGNEETGNIQPAEAGVEGSSEAGNTVLQAEQTVHTRGEEGVESESAEVGGEVSEQDVVPSVPSAEQSAVESVLDEDMPDFTAEAPKAPVAPNPVENPVELAQEEEKKLLDKLERIDLSRNEKRDWAYKYGKKAADMFATQEEYGAYEEVAEYLGEFLNDFNRGVEESFANRPQYHIGDSVNNNTEASQLATEAVLTKLEESKIPVERVSDKQTAEMLEIRKEVSQSPIELMTVYHGSRAKFESFDHSHMGEGEGAQAHGWGTYVAVNQETGRTYATLGGIKYIGPKVKYDSVEYDVVSVISDLLNTGSTFEEAINGSVNFWSKYDDERHNAMVAFAKTLSSEDFSTRNLYTVEIPEDTGSNYFSEESLTKEQLDKFVEACNNEGISWEQVLSEASEPTNILNYPGKNGKRIYHSLAKALGSDKAASEFLSRAGFVGIKYDGRRDGECYVIFDTNDAKITGHVEFYQTPNGTVYGWTDGKKIYLTEVGMNPNTPIHEYTHLWAKAMMQKNPKGWNSIKQLLKKTPVWNEVMNDANYSNIHGNEDMVTSEVLSRLSGTKNAAKLERMAQQMIDEAKGTMRKAEARGLIQNIKDALNKFWSWVGKHFLEIESFSSVDEITDRVLWDLVNKTDLGELSEGQVETQIVTDPKVIAELEASPKTKGFRNVVKNDDGTFSSPMAYWLQSTKGGAKTRIETAKFKLGKWEEAEEHPELVDDKGKITLVKPNKSTVGGVAYDPYIHNRLEPVNLQFKDAWKRNDLVYVETEVSEDDLNSGYQADKALLPVGVHSWSNGDVMLSKYDKPVRIMEWDEVADAWAKRLNGKGVEFDVVPPAMLSLLVERGVEIRPPHKGMGKDCNEAYKAWQKKKTTLSERSGAVSGNSSSEGLPVDGRGHLSHDTLAHPLDIAKVAEKTEATKAGIKKLFNAGKFKGKITDAVSAVREVSKALKLQKSESSLSYYSDLYEGDFDIDGKIAHVRVSGHPANGERMGNIDADSKISIVIYDNGKHISTGEHEGYTEYTYYTNDISPEDAAWSVANGIRSLLNGNGFVDNTGKVKEKTYPFVDNSGNLVYRKSDTQNAAIEYLAGDTRLKAIEHAVSEEAKKLGVNVTYKTREQMPSGHKNDKGYYNTSTGEIVICTENASSVADAIQTILHEAVAHNGLRQLMGDKFNEFINRVYNSLDAETKAKVDALAAEQYDGNTAVAMEEYMASLAETENFAENSVWDTIKSIFEDIINAILGRNDIKIGDNELRYILRASYNNMVNPKGMDSVKGWAQDQLMREELGINQASTPEILYRTGIDDIAFTTAREAYETVTFNGFTEIMKSIMNATGFKAKAQAVKTGLLKIWNEYQMENQDAQQAVIAGIEAIQRETGDMPIEDFENYLLAENQMQSRAAEEIESFLNNQFASIVDQINDIITSVMKARGLKFKNKKQRAEIYNEVRQYLIAKHGIERNKYYQNSTGEMRDFSGLTALFGLPDTEFALAETMAQDMVDKFEAEIGDAARDALWNKINAATRKTLRHAYESGLLSRAQHDKIRDMFDFYIPLRGFDETTAEDVYNYASYDGNRFQPAVREAHGRTSVAFDPISVIMNMAQSEIIQGNKNRVKQALYHFIGNRPNSLLTPRECWYVLDKSTGAFVEAYPDIANGETWEQFEIRMQALEATGDAMKQKKGLDVGYRFQKPTNKDEHYIHLKINGVEHAIYVNGNPRLAEGVNGFSRQNERDVISGVKKANRMASQLFTNYNYKFGGKNFFRDFIWAQTVMFIKESPMYNLRFAGNWFVNNPITIGSLMRKYKNGTLDMTNQNDVLFKEFIENGGKTGYVFIDALEKQKRRIDKAIERMSKIGNTKTNALTKAAILFEIINYANECIELAARFATYVTSRNTKDKSGNARSIMQAIDNAKSITTNFNRKGAQSGRGLIGGIAYFMGSLNFFYNAAVQGVQQVKGLHNEHPVKTKAVLGGWVALGFMMPYIINIFRGDDDDEIYWNLPEYERKNNICIPFGKGKVTMTIPLSPIVREGYAIGVTLSDAMFNKSVDKDATMLSMECATLLAKALLPANPVEGLDAGLTPAENLLMFGTPDIADPLVEAVINKDWTGSPIEYRTTYNEGAPHYTKVVGKDNWKERIGEKLYKAGEDNLDSSLDINLSAWEHIFSSGAGGLGVFAKDITNIIDWVTEWKAPERLNDIPVARTLFSSNAMDDEKFVNNIYWDMDDVYKKKTKNIKSVYNLTEKEVYGEEEGRGEANLVKVYEAKAYPFLKRYYELNKEIKKMQNDIDKMPTDTEVEKNDKVLAEQDLFNKRRDLVYELLEYEIE